MRVVASHNDPTSRTVRLLLVDDHALVVMAMTAAFDDAPDIELVGTASTAAEAVERTISLRPDVVLLDRRLPDGDGVAAIGRLLDVAPDVRVLLFTGAADQSVADRVADAGGAGVLLKAGVLEDMLNTIRSVAAGHSSFDVRPSGRPRVR
ncbi:MAG TPA: response regulator transcription factor [Actinophytocola sp.]|jgi:DNA-binding NarL/FixJ family response regulator|uniref:response regulator n=1 Tax=Actinophytocola sp. TaxID=1872138 RepID=UPI002F9500DB